MNQEQLNAIKERVAKATPGPWESEETVEGHIDIFNPNEDYAVCQTGNETYDCLNDGDTEFIKHSITDVPALVAEVERLREVLKGAAVVSNQAKGLVEENKRLRKALTEILDFKTFDLAKFETEVIEIARQALAGESDVQRKQDHHT